MLNTLVPQNVLDNAIDLRLTLTASLVVKAARIAHAGQNQSVADT